MVWGTEATKPKKVLKYASIVCIFCVKHMYIYIHIYIHISNQTGLVSEIYLCLCNSSFWLHEISLGCLNQTPNHRGALLGGASLAHKRCSGNTCDRVYNPWSQVSPLWVSMGVVLTVKHQISSSKWEWASVARGLGIQRGNLPSWNMFTNNTQRPTDLSQYYVQILSLLTSWNCSSEISALSVYQHGVFPRVLCVCIPRKVCHNPIYVPINYRYIYLWFRNKICSPLGIIFPTAVSSFYEY